MDENNNIPQQQLVDENREWNIPSFDKWFTRYKNGTTLSDCNRYQHPYCHANTQEGYEFFNIHIPEF